MHTLIINRQDFELPCCTAQWGWIYHHMGIPTDQVLSGEIYLPQFRMYVTGFTMSPFGVEWMRFEKDSPIDPLIQTVPHLAFKVEDLDHELKEHSFNIITKPNSPSQGIRVAMIEHHGAPIELIEFDRSLKRQSNA